MGAPSYSDLRHDADIGGVGTQDFSISHFLKSLPLCPASTTRQCLELKGSSSAGVQSLRLHKSDRERRCDQGAELVYKPNQVNRKEKAGIKFSERSRRTGCRPREE